MMSIENFIRDNFALFTAIFLGAIIVLLVWNIIIQIKASKIRRRTAEILANSNIKNLEDVLALFSKNIKSLDKEIQELYSISNQINNLAFRGLHKVGIVRFNPFKEVGGDQSFSIALLNGKNNGLVLSSLFTREGARIYSKSVLSGVSEKYPLTGEEKKAIQIAISQDSKKIS